MHQVRRIKSNKPERGVGIWQVAEVQHHVRLNAQRALASRVAARVVGDCQRLAAHVAAHPVRLIAVKPHSDRQSVVSAKSVSVRLDIGGWRLINKNNHKMTFYMT